MSQKSYWDFARYGSIGISWVLSTSIYFYLGYKAGIYLDARLGSAPLFLLAGLLGAMALSMRALIVEISAIIRGTSTPDGNESRTREPRPASDREKSNKKAKEPR